MPARRRPGSESSSRTSSQLPGVMEARRRRRRRRGGSRRRRRRSSSEDPQQDEVRSQSSGASSRSASVEPELRATSRRSCHLGNVNPYINFVSSSKGLYAGRPFRSMVKGLAARWRALPESERKPFILQARRSQAEIAKTAAAEGRLVAGLRWRLPHRRRPPGQYFQRRKLRHPRPKARRRTLVFLMVEPSGQMCKPRRPETNYRSCIKMIIIPTCYYSLVVLLVVAVAFFFFWVPRDWLFEKHRRLAKKQHKFERELDS